MFAVSTAKVRVLSQLGFTVVVSSLSGFLGFTKSLSSIYYFLLSESWLVSRVSYGTFMQVEDDINPI